MLVELIVLSLTIYILWEYLIVPFDIITSSNGPLASQIATFFQQLFHSTSPIQLQLFTFLKLYQYTTTPSIKQEYQYNFITLFILYSKKIVLEKDKEKHFEEKPLYTEIPVKITWMILLIKQFDLKRNFEKEWRELCSIWSEYLRQIQFSKTMTTNLLQQFLFSPQSSTTDSYSLQFYLNIHSHYSKFLQPLLPSTNVHLTSTEIEQLSQISKTNGNGMVRNEFAKFFSKNPNSMYIIVGGTRTFFHLCHALLCNSIPKLNCIFIYCGNSPEKEYTFVNYSMHLHSFFKIIIYPCIVHGYFLQMFSEVSLNWFHLQKEFASLQQFTNFRILQCHIAPLNKRFGFGQSAQCIGNGKVKLIYETQSKKTSQQLLHTSHFLISKFQRQIQEAEKEEQLHDILIQQKDELPSKGFYLHLLQQPNMSIVVQSCKIEIPAINGIQLVLDEEVVCTVSTQSVIISLEASESHLQLFH